MELVKSWLLLIATGMVFFATAGAQAQQPQGPVGSDAPVAAAPATAPLPSQSAITTGAAAGSEKMGQAATAPDALDADVVRLRNDFGLLKILGLVSIVLAATIGLAWYAYRHANVLSFDTLGGALLSVVLAPILLSGATLFLSTDSTVCLSQSIGTGGDPSSFADACRAAREGTANMIGLKWLWAMVFGQSVVQGLAVAYSSAIIKTLMYASVCIAAPLLFFALKPVIKATLYKKR